MERRSLRRGTPLPVHPGDGARTLPFPALEVVEPRSVPRTELDSVQLLRAVAALLVALWHLPWVARAFPDALPAAPTFLAFGYAGVDLFFVISGFIICHITAGRVFQPGRFAARRFFRILPLYAGFTALALLAVAINPAWDAKGVLDAGYALRSLLAVPMHEGPYLDVGWSLEHELIFYALAGGLLAFGRGRWLPIALAALFAAGVLLHVVVFERSGSDVWDWHLFSLYHVEFLAGVLVFRWRDRLAALGWVWPLAAGAAGFLLVSHVVAHYHLQGAVPLHVPTVPTGWSGLVRVLGYGLCGALLLCGLLEAERRGKLVAKRPAARLLRRVLLAVGAASYVLYLGHWFVYSALSKLYTAAGVPPSLAAPALAAALVAALAFAWAVHRAVEQPLLAAVRRRF